jgi:AcrR family transcriptional regulator
MDKGPEIVREFEIMPGKKTDRRSNRTRRQLSSALVELVKEKRFDDITVQNVIDRADVGRSTFYSHFRDKDDLFQKDWERFLDGLAQHIDWDKAGAGSFVPVVYLFRHLQDAQPFYQSLVRSQKTDSIFKSGVNYLSQKIESALTARLKGKPTSVIPIPVLSNYLASELFSLLKWWLDRKMPYPPERMDQIFHDLVTPTLLSVLQNRVYEAAV